MDQPRSRSVRRLALSALVLGVFGTIMVFGSLAAFTASTTNAGNQITAGSVAIGDNASGAALYSIPAGAPTTATQKCIRVTYTGSLAAAVKMYVSTVTNGDQFNLKVERGTQTTGAFPACGDFAATATVFDGDLGTFGTTYAAGYDVKGSGWVTSDSVALRLSISVKDDVTPNAHTTPRASGSHTFTWEARSS